MYDLPRLPSTCRNLSLVERPAVIPSWAVLRQRPFTTSSTDLPKYLAIAAVFLRLFISNNIYASGGLSMGSHVFQRSVWQLPRCEPVQTKRLRIRGEGIWRSFGRELSDFTQGEGTKKLVHVEQWAGLSSMLVPLCNSRPTWWRSTGSVIRRAIWSTAGQSRMQPSSFSWTSPRWSPKRPGKEANALGVTSGTLVRLGWRPPDRISRRFCPSRRR